MPQQSEEGVNIEEGFATSFAPPPPDVVATDAEAQPRPAEDVSYTYNPRTSSAPVQATIVTYPPQVTTTNGPSVRSEVTVTVKALKLLGPVGAYPTGSVVPANMFDDVDRLLKLGVAEYTDQQAMVSQPDPDMVTAMKLAQPLSVHRSGIPQAPWVQSSVYDIIGPAIARSNYQQTPPRVMAAPEGYRAIPGEFGQTLMVAEPLDKTQSAKDQVESPTDPEA